MEIEEKFTRISVEFERSSVIGKQKELEVEKYEDRIG